MTNSPDSSVFWAIFQAKHTHIDTNYSVNSRSNDRIHRKKIVVHLKYTSTILTLITCTNFSINLLVARAK